VDRWAAGGILKHINDLCESFKSKGLDCIVAAWLAPGEQLPLNAEFQNLPLYSKSGSKSFLGFWRSVSLLRAIVKSKRVEIVHMHNRYVTLLSAVAFRGRGLGRIFTVHNIFYNLRFLPWYPRNVICLNEVGKQDFLRNYFLPKKLEIAIVPNGIQINSAMPYESRRFQGSKFVYIGRLEKPKGLDVLIRAVAELGETDVHVSIVGSGSEEKALCALTKELGVDDKIEFLGYMDNPETVLDDSLALILPATSLEGFGYVVIEAFAHRCAVISSDLGVFDETVIDGVTGKRFKSGDYLSLANVMRSAMENKEKMVVMGNSGFSLACEKFTLEQMVNATFKVYCSSTKTALL